MKEKSKYKIIFDDIKPGHLFTYWQVLDSYLVYKNRTLSAKCLCTKCNITISEVCCSDLLNGKSTKCRDCYLGSSNGSVVFKTYKGIISTVFYNIKKSARKRNIEFNITMENIGDLFEKQNNKCSLSGLELRLKKHYLDNTSTASLDRIDNNKGYTIDNIQWIHKDINFMKRHYDQEYFIHLCEKIAHYTINKIRQ